MSMPSNWVEEIFRRLTVVYGHHFLGRWSGMDLGPVKEEWGRELSFYGDKPKAIKYALENLPADNPPNVLQFRALCRQAPEDKPLALPAPNPEGLKRIAKELAAVRARLTSHRRNSDQQPEEPTHA